MALINYHPPGSHMGNTENRNKRWNHEMLILDIVRVADGTLPEGCGLEDGRINVINR